MAGTAFLTSTSHQFGGGVAETIHGNVGLETRRTERTSVVCHEGGHGDTAVNADARFADRPAVVSRVTGHLEWNGWGGDVKGATSSTHRSAFICL